MKKEKLEKLADIYTDYLIVANGSATATSVSETLDNTISHDSFTRMLKEGEFSSKYLWNKVKKTVREIQSEEGYLILDDTIVEKQYLDENEIVCWHYDHTKGKSVKGFNILNMLYYSNNTSMPVGFEVIKKNQTFMDKNGQTKRKADISKNELSRALIDQAIKNQIPFRFVLMDSWFSSKENLEYIDSNNKDFIVAIKNNRLFAKTIRDKLEGNFVKIEDIKLEDKESIKGYIKGYNKEIILTRRVFTNKDDSIGILNLICSDISLTGELISIIYEKRWKIEEYHKSLKSNASLGKSQAKRVVTQISHLVMSMISVFKLECFKIKSSLNHFALRAKIMLKANLIAMKEIRVLRGEQAGVLLNI